MRVGPSKIEGEIKAQPSKSIMQRAVAIAALAEGTTTITNPSFCDDSLAAIEIARAMGATIEVGDDCVKITPSSQLKSKLWNCNESGLCMRMFSPIAALFSEEITLVGAEQLMRRPVNMIEKPLQDLGANCKTNNGLPPVTVKGSMQGGVTSVDGSTTSQFISGLLIALPLCEKDSRIDFRDLRSSGYILLTESMVFLFGARVRFDPSLECFLVEGNQGYASRKYEVDGDWSSAAFMLVAGAIAGDVIVNQLSSSIQPDQGIKTVLTDVGAEIKYDNETISVVKKELRAFEYDATHSPDLFPPLVALACNCKGISRIIGVERLRHKESDRASTLVQEFTKIGADIKTIGNAIEITGKKLTGGEVDSHGDHRIAMACAIAALNSEKGVEIENANCVSKSYPSFFKDLKRLGVNIVEVKP